MSVWFNGHGILTLKEETSQDFFEKLQKLSVRFDDVAKITFQNNVIEFENYARHYFIDEFEKLCQENIDMIENSFVTFSCYDEDGSIEHPFPYVILYEITEGQLFTETLNTRLCCDFYHMAKEQLEGNLPYHAISEPTVPNNTSSVEECLKDDLPF